MSLLGPEDMSELRKGVQEFNSGRFFECHDILEEIWRGAPGPARDFLQGLIHLAVGFYHLNNGNLLGGESQLSKALLKLSVYGDQYLNLDLLTLRGEVQDWITRIRNAENLMGGTSNFPRLHFHKCDSQATNHTA